MVDNGAGPSREARVTALGLGRMLQQAWVSPRCLELVSPLPIAGIDGTLRRSKSKAARPPQERQSARCDGGGRVCACRQRAPLVLVAIVNHPSVHQRRGRCRCAGGLDGRGTSNTSNLHLTMPWIDWIRLPGRLA